MADGVDAPVLAGGGGPFCTRFAIPRQLSPICRAFTSPCCRPAIATGVYDVSSPLGDVRRTPLELGPRGARNKTQSLRVSLKTVTLETRERWIRAAAGWEARADQMARDTMPVSVWMVEAIAPQPGHTVLDLAAGIGDTGYLAAELIKPGGTLITSDFAPEMLAAAQRRAQAKGITNVRFRQMDMNVPLDQPAASLDGVLGRWAFMLSTTARPRSERRGASSSPEPTSPSPPGPTPTRTCGAPQRSGSCKGAASSTRTRQGRDSSPGAPLT